MSPETPEAQQACRWLALVMSEQWGELQRLPAPDAALVLEQAKQHDVVALVNGLLDRAAQTFGGAFGGAAHAWLRPTIQTFAPAVRELALVSMYQETETRGLLSHVQDMGVACLLLKGSALAHWAYEAPHLRACGDVDVLLPSREVAEQLATRLCLSGLRRLETPGDLVAYELTCTRTAPGGIYIEVDVHWRLANSPLFAHVFTFDELMAGSIALPSLGAGARGLSPEHACIHACMHRALNLSIGVQDKLKWLYDLHVLASRLQPNEWQRLVQAAVDKNVAGVVAQGLQAATNALGQDWPQSSMASLQQAASQESLDATRLTDWRYMQEQTYRSLGSFPAKLRWIWQRVFPSSDYMRYLYGGEGGYGRLMIKRLQKVVTRLLRSRP